jgi:hypothetical protein
MGWIFFLVVLCWLELGDTTIENTTEIKPNDFNSYFEFWRDSRGTLRFFLCEFLLKPILRQLFSNIWQEF